MSTSWLYEQLSACSNVTTDGGNPVLGVSFSGKTEYVYCPNSSEYIISADVVQKAKDLGATIIAYGSWCGASYDASQYGKKLDVSIMPYRSFFAYLKQKGVNCPKQ